MERSGLKKKGIVGNNTEVSSLVQAETYGISVRQRDTCAGMKPSVQTQSGLEFLKYRLWAKQVKGIKCTNFQLQNK